jgi:protein TonB
VIDLASAKETIAETEHTIPVKSKLKSFPKIIKKVNPVYSKLARSRGIEGTVILSFAIDKKGKVRKIKVDKSSPLKLLDGSARMALRKWRFDPNSISVNNINHRYQQIFSFNLSNYDLCMAGSIGTRLAPEQICQDL